jgi:Clp amino terminal domain, pathogenicity island component
MSPLPARLDDLIAHVLAQPPEGDALAHLRAAAVAGEQLGELSDHLIGHFVDQARRAGASWTEIGRSMGVTKQAAQQRFVPRAAGDPPAFDASRFGRFTDRARKVLVRAEAEARQAGHDHVGVEHVVLGLLDQREALAARAIEAQGVSLDDARVAIVNLLGPAGGPLPEHIPFSPAAKKLLELTLREALRMGHNYVGTEHVLLAVLSDDTPSAIVLSGIGVERDAAEAWITAQLATR